MSKISVIVPVYQVEKYLCRCLDSILNQTYNDLEIILINDGSLDDGSILCDNYACKDNRVHVIHKKNGGLSDARNVGIELTINKNESKWITFVDSDDWINHNYLKYLYESVVSENADVSCNKYLECKSENTYLEDGAPIFSCYNGEDFCVEEYKYSQTAWGKLFKLEQWRDLRFPVGKIHEDAFTIYTILLPAQKIAFVDNPPLYYFNSDNEDSITRKKWTPKRMDLLCALEEKIEYSKRKGYKRYYLIQIKEYINTLGFNYHCAKEQNDFFSVKYIQKKTKAAMRIHESRVIFPFEEQNYWIYEIAYPGLMKQYWRLQSIKSKLKGRKQ